MSTSELCTDIALLHCVLSDLMLATRSERFAICQLGYLVSVTG